MALFEPSLLPLREHQNVKKDNLICRLKIQILD